VLIVTQELPGRAYGRRMFADLIFLAVVIALVLALVQLYTRSGSGISQHPYRHVHGGAPGAAGQVRRPSEIRSWSRGAR
jgi:hypothetical protein